jgi:hypothetical protein
MLLHIYSEYKNKTLNWLPSDTEELYLKNLKNEFYRLEKFGWIDNKIQYKFNSNGFRGDEITTKPSLLALGCSFTVGIGLHYEQTWPWLVSQILQLNCINMGLGGSSNDTAFRLADYYIPKIKPRIVFLLSPEKERLEILNYEDQSIFYWPSMSPIDAFYRSWIINENNALLDEKKNILAIKQLCSENKIKFVHASVQSFFKNYANHPFDYARDLMHLGPKSQKLITEHIMSSL